MLASHAVYMCFSGATAGIALKLQIAADSFVAKVLVASCLRIMSIIRTVIIIARVPVVTNYLDVVYLV